MCVTVGKRMKTTGLMAGAVHKQATSMQMAGWNDSGKNEVLWQSGGEGRQESALRPFRVSFP